MRLATVIVTILIKDIGTLFSAICFYMSNVVYFTIRLLYVATRIAKLPFPLYDILLIFSYHYIIALYI